ncbi:MoxR family ATPase [Acinetobacter nosocomialis]|uniref:MoxR family ATPase n=1 Tax=Acinetobacter nosocomialis TaxID=106654 RepID=UPI0033AB163E
MSSNEPIVCRICGTKVHLITPHLKKSHPEITVEQYKESYPDAELYSPLALKKMEEEKAKREAAKLAEEQEAAKNAVSAEPETTIEKETSVSSTNQNVQSALTNIESKPTDVVVSRPFHEIFGLTGKNALSGSGKPIPISCIENSAFPEMVPEINDTYVWDVDELKDVMIALELNINPYVWGHKGAGKSELAEQIAARTGRPFVRIQHTSNTEEAHIVGMWTVKNGETVFEFGPLALAMKNGWMYLADEYDFAQPSVLSVYQAVLEGKPLMIKEADKENRLIKPHPNFRFIATGNTNGSGDETGLYQGTNLQNSANYDRFGSVIYKSYMKKSDESLIIQKRVGLCEEDADKLVDFANLVRDQYAASKISDTISPRSLINAAMIGLRRNDFKHGLKLAFSNKLSKVDKQVAEDLAQRVFG